MASSLGVSQLQEYEVGRESQFRDVLSPEQPLLKPLPGNYILVKTLRMCASDLFSDGVIIKCNYELCVKVVHKSNIQSKTQSRVTHMRDNIKTLDIRGRLKHKDIKKIGRSSEKIQDHLPQLEFR
jgi:hypothetical protein